MRTEREESGYDGNCLLLSVLVVYVCTCVYVCVRVRVYVCVCVCVPITHMHKICYKRVLYHDRDVGTHGTSLTMSL